MSSVTRQLTRPPAHLFGCFRKLFPSERHLARFVLEVLEGASNKEVQASLVRLLDGAKAHRVKLLAAWSLQVVASYDFMIDEHRGIEAVGAGHRLSLLLEAAND